MNVKVKKVYYCDFCKKHSLRSLEKHERGCTANPDRECGWHPDSDKLSGTAGEMRPIVEWASSLTEVSVDVLDELRERTDGCPACMLNVVRLSRHDVYEWHKVGWDYVDAVERFNRERQENEDRYAYL